MLVIRYTVLQHGELPVIETDHHSSDVQGLRGVHLAQSSQGFCSASATHTLLILTLSVLDQTSTNCHSKVFGMNEKSWFVLKKLVLVLT